MLKEQILSRRIKTLISIGKKAICLNEDCRYHLSAVGITKTNEVFIGIPKTKSHPLQKKYYETRKTIHAELDLVLKAGDRVLTNIVVIRKGKDGSLRLAKPCKYCQEVLQVYQPDAHIYYTDYGGMIQKLK